MLIIDSMLSPAEVMPYVSFWPLPSGSSLRNFVSASSISSSVSGVFAMPTFFSQSSRKANCKPSMPMSQMTGSA
ncbi:hypothetical protein D9M72_652390 [compost metagenome]